LAYTVAENTIPGSSHHWETVAHLNHDIKAIE